jgi:hypothetical protein
MGSPLGIKRRNWTSYFYLGLMGKTSTKLGDFPEGVWERGFGTIYLIPVDKWLNGNTMRFTNWSISIVLISNENPAWPTQLPTKDLHKFVTHLFSMLETEAHLTSSISPWDFYWMIHTCILNGPVGSLPRDTYHTNCQHILFTIVVTIGCAKEDDSVAGIMWAQRR